MSLGQSDGCQSAGCAAERKTTQSRLFIWEGCWTWLQRQGSQEAPAQDGHNVHLLLPAAVWRFPRLNASARIKLLCWGVLQHIQSPQPQAGAGTGHCCWEVTPHHLHGHHSSGLPHWGCPSLGQQDEAYPWKGSFLSFFVVLLFSLWAAMRTRRICWV